MIVPFNAIPNVDTLAHFKTWAKGISDALAAIGWVKTGDSGQVDFSTIVSLPGSNTTVYEIWNAADAKQSDCPIFLRIDYGNTGGSNPKIIFTAGTGSDGAGTITGNVADAMSYTFDPNTTTYQCWVTGDTSWAGIMMFPSAFNDDSSIPFAMQIERSHAEDGTDSDEYFTMVGAGSAAYQASVFKPGTGTAVPKENKHMNFAPTTNTTATIGSATWFCPTFPFVGKMGNPMVHGGVKQADTLDQATLVVKFYGVDHTLIAMKNNPFSNVGTGTSLASCWRYE